jgi:serine/threonine-protein kinase
LTDPLPTRIGRYEILDEIGRGMMGVVYRAHDSVLHRTVALKTIQLAMAVPESERAAFEERFFTEARAAARLSHSGIVVVHDVGRDDSGTLFMALEYLKGTTLAARLAEGQRLEWREALKITGRLAEALFVAHSDDIVHRDIKPANIMLLESGEPKIMDFGIAKVLSSEGRLTSTGQFFGTPLFMSPEQALGKPLDGRSDLFSLGVVTYELLTGQRPFEAENVPRILTRVAYEEPPPPSSLSPGLPTSVDYVLARTLAKQAADRYPTGKLLADDIEDVLADRSPRHQAAWAPARSGEGTLVSQPRPEPTPPQPGIDIGSGTAPVSEARAPLAGLEAARTGMGHVPPSDPEPPSRRGRWVAGSVLGVLALTALAGGALVLRQKPDDAASAAATPTSREATPEPRPRATPTPPATPEPTPEPTPRPTPRPKSWFGGATASLVIDFEHHLKSGRIWLWIDKKLVLEEDLSGRVRKDVLGIKLRKGKLNATLDVTPGWHDLWVEVQWDDNRKSKGISADFREDSPRKLRIRVGRLRKNLSLKWQ